MTRWYLKAFFHELLKFKFKAMWWYLVDPTFREEINLMRKDLPFKEYKTRLKYVRYTELRTSHRVIYPEWVNKLVKDIRRGMALTPIHCIETTNGHKVVDGHHRLAAFHKAYNGNGFYVPVMIREYSK